MSTAAGRVMRTGALGLAAGALIYYVTDTRASLHSHVTLPMLRWLLPDAEDSHRWAVAVLNDQSPSVLTSFVPRERRPDPATLGMKFAGRWISNGVGLAAGFDKDGVAMEPLFRMGFGLVEVGSVTPEPQPGNPKPRVWRLPLDEAVINRYGFNSEGSDQVLARLRRFRSKNGPPAGHLLGVNLGKNKWSPQDSAQDYVDGIRKFSEVADYLVVNISSPNTPGLRSLQAKGQFRNLCSQVALERDRVAQERKLDPKPALFVKIAPDLNDSELADVAEVVMDCGLDGIIISNTTVQRSPSLLSEAVLTKQAGGLSGKPLKPLALETVRKFYRLTHGTVPIMGCGGIRTGKDAVEFMLAGASLIQMYSGFAYQGPRLICDVKDALDAECHRRGLSSCRQLVGLESHANE